MTCSLSLSFSCWCETSLLVLDHNIKYAGQAGSRILLDGAVRGPATVGFTEMVDRAALTMLTRGTSIVRRLNCVHFLTE
jgi:hypothetical protein